MDPIEQHFVSDSCLMLGMLGKATVHCRGEDLKSSTPAGSRSMKSQVPSCYVRTRFKGNHSLAMNSKSSLRSKNSRVNSVTLHGVSHNSRLVASSFFISKYSEKFGEDEIAEDFRPRMENVRKNKSTPINRLTCHATCSSNFERRPNCKSNRFTYSINQTIRAGDVLSACRHTKKSFCNTFSMREYPF